jgi:hypothetical protein
MLIITAIIGLAILVIGRQLFWVAVSGIGFILGLNYATQFYQGPPHIIVLISLGVGVIGAILAYLLERAAAGLVGFLAGWYLTSSLLAFLDWNPPGVSIYISIFGGILGLILIFAIFDWSLIILSSLAGSTMIVQALQFNSRINTIIFIILLVMGITIQGVLLSQEQDEIR